MSRPRTMAEDDGRMAAEFVRLSERASTRRGGAEHLEEVAPHKRTLQPPAIGPDIDVRALRDGNREHARLAHERIRLLAGEPLGFRVRGSLTFDREQFARIAHVVRAEDHGVEERKYNGHQP